MPEMRLTPASVPTQIYPIPSIAIEMTKSFERPFFELKCLLAVMFLAELLATASNNVMKTVTIYLKIVIF